MELLIKNGNLVNAEKTIKADLLIKGEKINRIDPEITPTGNTEVIDATGKYILPGGVDAHVHLDLPMFGTVSSDDHYTGTKAAACGGTTTVIDFVSQNVDDLEKNISKLREKADKAVAIDYGLHMNITHLTPEVEKQIPQLTGWGVSSVKVFTAYNNRLRLSDGDIFRVLRLARDHGILTLLHAENGDLIELLVNEAVQSKHTSPIWHARTRPGWGAVEAVARGSALAAVADAPLYIVHMNMRGEVDQLEYARSRGLKIMGETCPQYLFFTEEDLERADAAKFICSPPLRKKEDQNRLWEGLRSGSIQTIATDHCPFFYDGQTPILYEGMENKIPGKELGKDDFTKIPNGLPGVGDRLPVLWTSMVSSSKFSLNEFVTLTSTNPARIFGMYPQKGVLAPGSDADIVIWDPNKEIQYGIGYAAHRTDYNLYEGWRLKGYPVRVISRGKTVVDNGNWFGSRGYGRFIRRKPFGEIL